MLMIFAQYFLVKDECLKMLATYYQNQFINLKTSKKNTDIIAMLVIFKRKFLKKFDLQNSIDYFLEYSPKYAFYIRFFLLILQLMNSFGEEDSQNIPTERTLTSTLPDSFLSLNTCSMKKTVLIALAVAAYLFTISIFMLEIEKTHEMIEELEDKSISLTAQSKDIKTMKFQLETLEFKFDRIREMQVEIRSLKGQLFNLATKVVVFSRQQSKNNNTIIELDGKIFSLQSMVKNFDQKLQKMQQTQQNHEFKVEEKLNQLSIQEKKQPQPSEKSAKQQPAQDKPQETNNQVQISIKDRSHYMNDQLLKISEKRSQKMGKKPIVSGDRSLVDLNAKNHEGKNILSVLYPTEKLMAQRRSFQEQREAIVDLNNELQSFPLIKYTAATYLNQEIAERAEWERVAQVHKLREIKEEMPICILSPGYNNEGRFRAEMLLNSVFRQNYSNYFLVLTNDASTDGTDQLYRKYLHFHNISKDHYAYIDNPERLTALQNMYITVHRYCSEDSIVINLDADDEFIGRNVLQVFNAQHQHKAAGVLYSNFYWYDQYQNSVNFGFTDQYSEFQRQQQQYRDIAQKFSHLRSFRAILFRQIKLEDLLDNVGKFYRSACDMVTMFPLMELSCGKVFKTAGFHYLYNINTGFNDYFVDLSMQGSVDAAVREKAKYSCDPKFKNSP